MMQLCEGDTTSYVDQNYSNLDFLERPNCTCAWAMPDEMITVAQTVLICDSEQLTRNCFSQMVGQAGARHSEQHHSNAKASENRH